MEASAAGEQVCQTEDYVIPTLCSFYFTNTLQHVIPSAAGARDLLFFRVLSTTRIAWMPDDRPGSWMYHCHILEHHAAGMMAHFDVVS